jgi:GT2 family glycosyltransferase
VPVAADAGLDASSSRDWSAVVLYYRSPDTIAATLRGILSQDLPPEETLVVDNDSGDDLATRLEGEFGGRVTLVTCRENVGYAAGMNLGRRHLQGSPLAILFATHEVVLEPHCARLLLDAMNSAGLAVAAPSLHLPDGRIWSMGGRIGWRGNVWHEERGTGAPIERCAWVDGAAVMAEVEAFDRLGGFDPRYFLYWEDVDLGWRAGRDRPGGVGCVIGARAVQDTKMAPERLSVRNRLWMWRRHRRYLRVLLSVADVGGRILLRDVLSGRWSVARDRLKGLREGLGRRPPLDAHATEAAVRRPL